MRSVDFGRLPEREPQPDTVPEGAILKADDVKEIKKLLSALDSKPAAGVPLDELRGDSSPSLGRAILGVVDELGDPDQRAPMSSGCFGYGYWDALGASD